MYLHVRQCSLPQRKEPRGWLESVLVRSSDLTSKSLRFLVRRNATRGVALNTLAER